MVKKAFDELPPEMQEQLRALEELADEDIDFSDIPETTDWSGAVRGKFYRPVSGPLIQRGCECGTGE